MSHTLRVRRHERLVRPHPGVVVHISRLGQTHHGVDQHIRPPLPRRADRQLPVGAVHGVTSLEGNHLAPGKLVEVVAELGRGVAERDIVVVRRRLDGLHGTADVKLVHLVAQVRHGRVGRVVGAHDLLRLERLVGLVDVFDGDDGQGRLITGVTKGDTGSGLDGEGGNVGGRDVEGDGHGEEGTLALAVDLGEAEGVTDTACVSCCHAFLSSYVSFLT